MSEAIKIFEIMERLQDKHTGESPKGEVMSPFQHFIISISTRFLLLLKVVFVKGNNSLFKLIKMQ